MLHHCQAKSLDDIYLEDIPHIIHPATAVHDLEDTALPNRIIQEWNLPQGYTQFVSRYHQFHHQRPSLAYRDTLDDIRYGKIVLLRKDITGNAGPGLYQMATYAMTCPCPSLPVCAISSLVS